MEKIRVRFAPSPTGSIHIGNVRTALYNWLFARHNGGEMLLRIDDTDRERSTEEAVQTILDSLRWLGLDWNGSPIRQSERMERYGSYADQLLESGHAYRCYCTPEELKQMRTEQMARKENPGYDGRCRSRSEFPEDRPYVVRAKVESGLELAFDDLVYGSVSVDTREIDDFVLIKSDGYPTYNFASSADDHDLEITHVIRGQDGLSNTPRQLYLLRLFGWDPPRFAHVPFILAPGGEKLSKRHGGSTLFSYREEGYLPDALNNYIARLGWGFGDQEIFSREELVRLFDLKGINKSAVRLDPEKCLWVSGEHLRSAPAEDVGRRWLPCLVKEALVAPEEKLDPAWYQAVVESLKGRCKTLVEMARTGRFFFLDMPEYQDKAVGKHWKPDLAPAIELLVQRLGELGEDPDLERIEGVLREVAEESGLKMRVFAQAVRVALTGGTASPPLDVVIRILGRDKVGCRLRYAIGQMRGGA